MGGECWGLGTRIVGCPERDRGPQEAQGSAPSPAGDPSPVGVRHDQRRQESVRHRPVGPGTPRACRVFRVQPGQTPCVATGITYFAVRTDAFESALGRWAQECLGEGEATIAIDGKALRGIHGRELPGVRLVAAFAGESGLVLGQKGGQG